MVVSNKGKAIKYLQDHREANRDQGIRNWSLINRLGWNALLARKAIKIECFALIN